MTIDRYTRYSPLHGISGNGQRCCYSRYTPLEGCNDVTLAQMVPMLCPMGGPETCSFDTHGRAGRSVLLIQRARARPIKQKPQRTNTDD